MKITPLSLLSPNVNKERDSQALLARSQPIGINLRALLRAKREHERRQAKCTGIVCIHKYMYIYIFFPPALRHASSASRRVEQVRAGEEVQSTPMAPVPNLQRGFPSTMGVRRRPFVYLSEADTGGSKRGRHLLSLKFM